MIVLFPIGKLVILLQEAVPLTSGTLVQVAPPTENVTVPPLGAGTPFPAPVTDTVNEMELP